MASAVRLSSGTCSQQARNCSSSSRPLLTANRQNCDAWGSTMRGFTWRIRGRDGVPTWGRPGRRRASSSTLAPAPTAGQAALAIRTGANPRGRKADVASRRSPPARGPGAARLWDPSLVFMRVDLRASTRPRRPPPGPDPGPSGRRSGRRRRRSGPTRARRRCPTESRRPPRRGRAGGGLRPRPDRPAAPLDLRSPAAVDRPAWDRGRPGRRIAAGSGGGRRPERSRAMSWYRSVPSGASGPAAPSRSGAAAPASAVTSPPRPPRRAARRRSPGMCPRRVSPRSSRSRSMAWPPPAVGGRRPDSSASPAGSGSDAGPGATPAAAPRPMGSGPAVSRSRLPGVAQEQEHVSRRCASLGPAGRAVPSAAARPAAPVRRAGGRMPRGAGLGAG